MTEPVVPEPRTFADAEAAEKESQPFTDAELQRLRHEPFAPLWSSLAGLVARFLATLDHERANRLEQVRRKRVGQTVTRGLLDAARQSAITEPDPLECGICGDYTSLGVEVHAVCLEMLSLLATTPPTAVEPEPGEISDFDKGYVVGWNEARAASSGPAKEPLDVTEDAT